MINLKTAKARGLTIPQSVLPADPLWGLPPYRSDLGHVELAEAGGLMAYAPDIVDLFRQAAGHVKKILDGASPGDLPLQYPSRWTLVVNLKTAKAIGVTLSATTLSRADQLIE